MNRRKLEEQNLLDDFLFDKMVSHTEFELVKNSITTLSEEELKTIYKEVQQSNQ